ncbi:hypothetical protein PGT21_030525 [Puccinia graminis f. sp. tritici]|uniref:superoxide dismutase n=2 Tax=Puccinia graminis f. sp. tritici TaxID=56615 RepID=A0A5B0Q3U7_PUCGR|nr:hypothetical protein PGT21_030525 [Puccinia graminis f. sp. tritici]KAA1107990.1 hypothetical protein PGTUg99_020859 [Puccinia graminis f. sp. tritici]
MLRKSIYLWVATCVLTCAHGQTRPSVGTDKCNVPLTAKAMLDGKFGITGRVNFQLVPGAQLVVVDVNLAGLKKPAGFGDYTYHVHTHPVGADGNCAATQEHLDPFNVGPKTPCDFHQPQLCQTGDLSGKFGKISSAQDTASMHYIEPFLKFSPQEQSILGRSIVLHAPDSTRLACGNITSWLDNTADLSGQPTLQPSTFTTKY